MNNKELKPDVLVVGFIPNGEKTILTIGKPRPDGTSEVVNAYQGEVAIALYKTLVDPESGEEGETDVGNEENDVPGTTGD